MKLWIDEARPAPAEYFWIKSINSAKAFIEVHRPPIDPIELIDLGDYVKLLNWLEKAGRNYPIRIHSQNPVGAKKMRRIIKRNGWKEVF